MKSFINLAILSTILLLSGCAVQTSASGYYWGNYSNTLYQVNKSPDENSISKHMRELQSIIEKSEGKNLKTPPGVFAELGMYYQKENKNEEALALYQKEISSYPESTALISKMISSVEK